MRDSDRTIVRDVGLVAFAGIMFIMIGTVLALNGVVGIVDVTTWAVVHLTIVAAACVYLARRHRRLQVDSLRPVKIAVDHRPAVSPRGRKRF